MDIAGAITTATATLQLVKGLRELEHELDKSELKSKMADLYGNLADVKIALVDAQGIIRDQEAEIEELKAKFGGAAELVEANGFQYAAKEDGTPVGLPFCPNCLAADGTQIRPAKLLNRHYQCPKCKSVYNGLTNYR